MPTSDIIYLILLLCISMLGSIVFKKLKPPFKVLVVLICVTLVSEIIARVMGRTIRNSNPVYHFFNIAELLLYALMYRHLLQGRLMHRLIAIAAVVIPAFALFNLFVLQPLLTFPSNVILVNYCVIILIAIAYFRQMLMLPSRVNILAEETFWLNALIILYCSYGFITLALYNYMRGHGINREIINTLAYFLNVIMYIGMGITTYINYRNNSKQPMAWGVVK